MDISDLSAGSYELEFFLLAYCDMAACDASARDYVTVSVGYAKFEKVFKTIYMNEIGSQNKWLQTNVLVSIDEQERLQALRIRIGRANNFNNKVTYIALDEIGVRKSTLAPPTFVTGNCAMDSLSFSFSIDHSTNILSLKSPKAFPTDLLLTSNN